MADIIKSLIVQDIRFPTSLEKDGSDAMLMISFINGLGKEGPAKSSLNIHDREKILINKDPDYSCPYVTLTTESGLVGNGITFTVGKGNDIVCQAVNLLSSLVVGKDVNEIFADFASFWRSLTSEDQMRWLGPEKGVMHMAVAAIVNALWDLWAKKENKPLWKLLVDMSPEQLVSTIDFRHIEDCLTKEEALEILKQMQEDKSKREDDLKSTGFPAYTTSCAWLGYTDEKIVRLCKEAQEQGFTRFKMKVGADLADDKRRTAILRQTMKPDNLLMIDANQRWEVPEAIAWVKELAPFKLTWIEEPTSPDDVLGHLEIAKALNPLGVGVATGEQCQNRIMFKQFLKSGAMQFCQIDCCRMGGVNEVLSVILMARKFKVPVCPHGGGVGLCELIQHMSIFDYISVSGSLDKRVLEYTDHLHEHFHNPCVIKNGHYMPPQAPGFSIDMKDSSLENYKWPTGRVWKKLISEGVYSFHQ